MGAAIEQEQSQSTEELVRAAVAAGDPARLSATVSAAITGSACWQKIMDNVQEMTAWGERRAAESKRKHEEIASCCRQADAIVSRHFDHLEAASDQISAVRAALQQAAAKSARTPDRLATSRRVGRISRPRTTQTCMALIARYIIDTSAAARMPYPAVSQRIAPLVEAGLVATTAALDAEALYGARTPVEYEQLWAERRDAYEYLPTNDEHWYTALGAQRKLAQVGKHRPVGIADLLTAALAAAHNLTVVHYDADFDTAATVLAFQHQWVMPRGAL